VRGLEAVTLCFPPTAGESIVKEDNKTNFQREAFLRQKDTIKYLYGGDAFF
jgi:hypothetical protein